MKISISLILMICAVTISAYANNRPFWTEKSSFVEGDHFYAVGVSSLNKTVEEGREKAFENARIEVMNFAQIIDVDSVGIIIETQMTYEEKNDDGTFNVYRLIKTDVEKLVEIQKGLQTTTKSQLDELNNVVEVNKALTANFIAKQQEMEVASRQIESTKTELSAFAQQGRSALKELEALKQDALQKQKELEQISRDLDERLKARDSSIQVLQQKKARYDEQGSKMDKLFAEISREMEGKAANARKYVKKGMSFRDVKRMLGTPDFEYSSILYQSSGSATLVYGGVTITFAHGVVNSIK